MYTPTHLNLYLRLLFRCSGSEKLPYHLPQSPSGDDFAVLGVLIFQLLVRDQDVDFGEVFLQLPELPGQIFKFGPLATSEIGYCIIAAVASVIWFEVPKMLKVS